MEYSFNTKKTKLENRRKILIKYLMAGILLGLLFPIIAIIYEFRAMDLDLTLESLHMIYDCNPLLVMISTAPLFLGIFSFVAGIKQAKVEASIIIENEISRIACHDLLTGLPNRLFLEEQLSRMLSSAQRHGNNAGILFIDLDNFKMINDNLGHDVGDAVLTETAKRIKAIMREEDIISRLGGDEFIVAVANTKEMNDVVIIAEKIMNSISRPFKKNGQNIPLSGSIGIAQYPQDSKDKSTLIKMADIAMYRAKEKGKNRIEVFHSAKEAKQDF